MRSFIKKSVVLGILFLSVAFVFAQEEDDSEWYWEKPISGISFEGLKNVKKSDLNGIVSTYIGLPFDEDTYTDLLDRLYATDLFEDIEPYAKHAKKEDEVNLVLQVTERPVIRSISFSGNKEIRNGELRSKIASKVSDIYVESKILVDERIIREFYISKGYTDATVSSSVENVNGEINVKFNINEGGQVVISKIVIQGNTIVSEKTLKSKMKLKEAGLLSKRFYQKSVMELDKQIILAYYMERGYMDANFVDVVITSERNESKGRTELTLTYIIQEGSQYTYTGTNFVGNEVFSTEKLESFITIKEGFVFNYLKYQESLSAVTNLYMQNGYMMLGFEPIAQKDSDRHEISFVVNITENSRSHVGNIIIKGNEKTKEFVIRREIPLEEGDVFSQDKVMSAYRNLSNLQYFSSILPEYQSGSEPNLVDIVISLEEQHTNSLQLGMAFSGTGMLASDSFSLPFSLFAKIENSNLFGEGRSIAASTSLSTTEQSIGFSYGQNWIKNLPIAFSQSLSFSHASLNGLRFDFSPNGLMDTNFHYLSYDSLGASLNTSLGKRWGFDYAILTLSGGISNMLQANLFDEGLWVPSDYGISQYANHVGLVNSVWTAFSADNRDINYNPSKGWFASQKFTWFGFIPKLESEFFLRSETKLEAYLQLFNLRIAEKWNFNFVLAAYTGFTNVFQVQKFLSESSKLYIDGMFNGRGWTNLYNVNRGKSLLANSVELRVPILPGYLGVDFFFDAVAMKTDMASMLSDLHSDDFFFSFGPGIRILMPQFPLHFVFAWKFKPEDGQLKWASNLNKYASPDFQFVLSFNVVNR